MTANMQDPPRWQYRFVNFSRACERMGELATLAEVRSLTDIEQEAFVGRFGVAWELAWKLLKDYLQHDGVAVDPITPRTVIRAAVGAGLIESAEPWFRALEARNDMAHTYNAELFQTIVCDILKVYHPVFASIRVRFASLLSQQ